MSALIILSIKCERCPRHLDLRIPESIIGDTKSAAALLAEARVNLRGHGTGWTKTPDGDFCPEHAP